MLECYNTLMSKLAPKEASEAKLRSDAYKHSCAIEGIHFTDREEKLFETILHEGMDSETAKQFIDNSLVEDGIIDEKFHSRNKK